MQGACSEALDVPAADSARMEIASRLDTGRASVCGCFVDQVRKFHVTSPSE